VDELERRAAQEYLGPTRGNVIAGGALAKGTPACSGRARPSRRHAPGALHAGTSVPVEILAGRPASRAQNFAGNC
jgi:hypothetical protein